jgi:type III secretion HrpO family protein
MTGATGAEVPLASLTHAAQDALLLVVMLSLPALAVAAVVGLVVAALQAASQIQDPTIAHLPRMLAVVAVLAIAAPWMGHSIAEFAARLFAGAS